MVTNENTFLNIYQFCVSLSFEILRCVSSILSLEAFFLYLSIFDIPVRATEDKKQREKDMKTTQFTTLDSRSCQSCQSSWVGGLKKRS